MPVCSPAECTKMVCTCSLVERLDLLPMVVLLKTLGKLPARRAKSAHLRLAFTISPLTNCAVSHNFRIRKMSTPGKSYVERKMLCILLLEWSHASFRNYTPFSSIFRKRTSSQTPYFLIARLLLPTAPPPYVLVEKYSVLLDTIFT